MNYKLKLPPYQKIYPIFYVHLLWPTKENIQYNKFSEKPPSKIIAGEEEWEIKDIINSETRNRVKEFLVHWKEYPNLKCIWKPEENLRNSKQILNAYKRRAKLQQ